MMRTSQLPAVSEVTGKIIELRRLSHVSAVVGLAMLIAVSLIAIWSLRQSDVTGYWVSHTYQVISTANQLLLDVKDAEAAARAYLLEPSESYQVDFNAAAGRTPDDLAKLKSLTADNAEQQERLSQLAPILSRRMQRLTRVIAIRTAAGLSESERLPEAEGARRDAGAISVLCQQIQSEEYRLLEERQKERRARLTQGLIGTLGSLFLALGALLVSAHLVHRAIGDLAESDQRRREYETMTTSLFEAAPESIMIVDTAGIIRRFNPETENLFGYGPDEIRDHRVEMLVPARLHSACGAFRGKFFSDDGARIAGRKFEINLQKKDGSEFIAEVSLGHIRSSEDSFAVAFTSDVTQRRADEVAIREHTQELQLLAGKLMTAQEDERRRIARNLHDDLNQKLAYLSMDIGRLVSKERADSLRDELKSLQQRARQAADFVRNISHQLHPSVLEDLGLESALEEFCDEFQDRSGITTTFKYENGPEEIRPDLASCVYYVTAECLRNVAKHADASTVSVSLRAEKGAFYLEIIDDGVGIAQQTATATSGIGIVAMRERLNLLGGNLEIHPMHDGGTRVSVNVPLGGKSLGDSGVYEAANS